MNEKLLNEASNGHLQKGKRSIEPENTKSWSWRALSCCPPSDNFSSFVVLWNPSKREE